MAVDPVAEFTFAHVALYPARSCSSVMGGILIDWRLLTSGALACGAWPMDTAKAVVAVDTTANRASVKDICTISECIRGC